MNVLSFILALLLAGAAFALGQRLGARAREEREFLHEQQAQERAAATLREAQTQAEAQRRALLDAAEAEAQQLRQQAQQLREAAAHLSQQAEQQARREAAALVEEAQARAAATAQAQREQLSAELQAHRREIEAQQGALNMQQSALEAQRGELEAQAAAARAELEERRSQLAEQRGEFQVLRDTLAAERAQLDADRQALKAELSEEREQLSADRQEYRRERDAMNRELERQSRRAEQLDARGERLDALEEQLDASARALSAQEADLQARAAEIEERLQEAAGLTRAEARERLLSALDAELEEEKAARIRAAQEQSSKEIARLARSITAQAIQRSAAETSAQLSVSVVPLPSDAMKGRLIGREGRNIRAFEALTGVDLIIDDTPEAVMLSSFNPLRREVARQVLESLIEDGRIHPARIEEMVERAQDDMRSFIHSQGEEAAIEASVVGLKPGMLQLLGRMYFRSSYGQNVLKHSVQVAHLTGIMADELGLDAALARRTGLLHDIGKSIDRELEGTHVEIGINLATRFGEPPEVIDAIAHHHDPENGETLYSVLVAAADAISAARPGARREELEAYTRRLEALEQIAVSFPGVQRAYAIQAGREVRVIVEPEQVSDAGAVLLARDVAGRIERDMEYPGQVQVTVVRESRASEIAH